MGKSPILLPNYFRFELCYTYDAITIFILHLAFLDLVYSVVNLPIIAFQHIKQQWNLGKLACQTFSVFRYECSVS